MTTTDDQRNGRNNDDDDDDDGTSTSHSLPVVVGGFGWWCGGIHSFVFLLFLHFLMNLLAGGEVFKLFHIENNFIRKTHTHFLYFSLTDYFQRRLTHSRQIIFRN